MNTKTLYLIRHAKAEEYSFSKRDYYREIVEKGKERATYIAYKLTQDITLTDNTLVISSSANRAIQTAELFCQTIGYPTDRIIQNKNIYEAYFKDILKAINDVDNSIDILLIFGHNPGLSDLTNYICNTYIDLKTSHIAKIELEEGILFSELSGGTGHLKAVITE